MPEYVKLCTTIEMVDGAPRLFQASDRAIAIYQVDAKFYALDDMCPHRGGPLSEGTQEKSTITCPWHGAKFDICTGKALSGPTGKDVESYLVRVKGGQIEVEI